MLRRGLSSAIIIIFLMLLSIELFGKNDSINIFYGNVYDGLLIQIPHAHVSPMSYEVRCINQEEYSSRRTRLTCLRGYPNKQDDGVFDYRYQLRFLPNIKVGDTLQITYKYRYSMRGKKGIYSRGSFYLVKGNPLFVISEGANTKNNKGSKRLKYTQHDADTIRTILERKRTDSIVYNRTEIETRIHEFAADSVSDGNDTIKVKVNKNIVLFLSGHGQQNNQQFQFKTGDGDFEWVAIDSELLHRYAEKMGDGKTIFVIVDACQSGGLLGSERLYGDIKARGQNVVMLAAADVDANAKEDTVKMMGTFTYEIVSAINGYTWHKKYKQFKHIQQRTALDVHRYLLKNYEGNHVASVNGRSTDINNILREQVLVYDDRKQFIYPFVTWSPMFSWGVSLDINLGNIMRKSSVPLVLGASLSLGNKRGPIYDETSKRYESADLFPMFPRYNPNGPDARKNCHYYTGITPGLDFGWSFGNAGMILVGSRWSPLYWTKGEIIEAGAYYEYPTNDSRQIRRDLSTLLTMSMWTVTPSYAINLPTKSAGWNNITLRLGYNISWSRYGRSYKEEKKLPPVTTSDFKNRTYNVIGMLEFGVGFGFRDYHDKMRKH